MFEKIVETMEGVVFYIVTVLAAIVVPMLAISPVFAADKVVREHEFEMAGIREVEIRGNVGTLEIRPAEGGPLTAVLDIEGSDRGWLRGTRDVQELDLVSTVDGDRLLLVMDEEDTETDWRITLPPVERVRVGFGIGEVTVEIGASALAVDLGIGEVEVAAPLASTGRIDLSAGIGETRISGLGDVQERRSFVSDCVRGRGRGDLPVRVEIGIGEALVDLR